MSWFWGDHIFLQKTFGFYRYASYAAQPSQSYGQSAQVRFNIAG